MSINDTVMASEVSSVEYVSPEDSPSFPARQGDLLVSLRSESLLEAANHIARYVRLGLIDSLDSLPYPKEYDGLIQIIEDRFTAVGMKPQNRLPRFDDLTSAFNDLAPTHEQAVQLITPAYLYLRARIIAEFDLEGNLIDATTGKELTGGSIPALKLERVSREVALKVDGGLTDFGFTNTDGDWCDTLDAMVSSSGVLFPTEGGTMNSLYWLPIAVCSPYTAKSPSIRAVAKALVDELHAAPPTYPIGVFLAVTTGVIAGEVGENVLAIDNGTLDGQVFYKSQ